MRASRLFFLTIIHLVMCNSTVAAELIAKDFSDLSHSAFIQKSLPHLDADFQAVATAIYTHLSSAPKRKIEKDIDVQLGSNQLLTSTGINFSPMPEVLGLLLSHLSRQDRDMTVMDIGCGYGYDTVMMLLSHKVKTVLAVDTQQRQLDTMKTELEEINASTGNTLDLRRVKYVKYNFAKPKPAPKDYIGKFDIINVNKVFHFLDIDQTNKMIANLHDMLAPGGHLFITTSTLSPHPQDLSRICYEKQKKQGLENPGLVYYIQTQSLIAGVPDTGGFIPRDQKPIADPGYMLILTRTEMVETRVMGRHIHTSESIAPYLSPYLDVIYSGNVTHQADTFLSIVAKKKE